MRNSQQGITMIGFALVLAVLGFFAYSAMKLIPAYTEYFGVVKSMKSVANEPNAATAPIEDLRRGLNTNFSIQYVDDATIPADGIKVDTAGGARKLHIVYDKFIPFLYNVSLVVHFDHSEDLLHTGSGY